jgi:hypothetical protein
MRWVDLAEVTLELQDSPGRVAVDGLVLSLLVGSLDNQFNRVHLRHIMRCVMSLWILCDSVCELFKACQLNNGDFPPQFTLLLGLLGDSSVDRCRSVI